MVYINVLPNTNIYEELWVDFIGAGYEERLCIYILYIHILGTHSVQYTHMP